MTTQRSADETRCLAFARFVFQRGLEHLRLSDPTCSAALLAFDDASELVLDLAARRLGAKTSERMQFMEHFDAIDEKLSQGKRAPLKVQMAALHDARNALKHRGRFPSRVQLEDYRASCERFLSELTEMVFGVAFFRLSLVDFVDLVSARDRLREAEQAIGATDYGSALEQAALAFEEMVHTHRSRRHRFGRSAYESGDNLSFVDLSLRVGESDPFVREVDHALKALLVSVRENPDRDVGSRTWGRSTWVHGLPSRRAGGHAHALGRVPCVVAPGCAREGRCERGGRAAVRCLRHRDGAQAAGEVSA